jgi:hypothetical protein
MFAKVLLLRKRGVLLSGPRPPEEGWATGIFETSASGFGGPATARRLVLRRVQASPDKGLIMELYQPTLVQAQAPYLRFRGIEAVPMDSGEVAAMVQEWLVRFNT